jgi:hypothetical protein
MDRIKEIQKRVQKMDNVLFFDKNEVESWKKITKTTKISDYEVLTDNGYVDIINIHETIPYEVYHLKLSNGKELKCADNHIIFDEQLNEIFVKDLVIGDRVLVDNNKTSIVIHNESLGYEEVMFDLELSESSNRRYYTNGILSHNTHLAKQLAKEIFGTEDSLIRVDMSEYQEKHSISKMLGTTAGFVGYDDGGDLTEKVKNKPYSVILFDEIEKAHKDIFNVLLQILDDGYVTDGQGRKVNFKNTLIILTSNLGIKKLQDFGNGIGFSTNTYGNEEAKKQVLMKEMKKFFSPEFLNRIDDTIVFNSLSVDNIKEIANIELNKLVVRLADMKYNISYDQSLVDYLAKIGYDELYGARPLKRAIQDKVEDLLSEEVLLGNLKEGKTYIVKMDGEDVKIVKKGK